MTQTSSPKSHHWNGHHLIYQPITDLQTGTVLHYEALSRWPDPHSTAQHLRRYEHRSGAAQLDERVILQAWTAAITTQIPVSVNLSAGLPAQALRTCLERGLRSGLSPQLLHLEITEHAPLTPQFERALRAAHQQGFTLSADDFGSGWANLERLTRLPYRYVKMDKRLTRDTPAARSVVRACASLGRELGAILIAEYVRSPEDAQRLQSDGVTAAQGELFSLNETEPTQRNYPPTGGQTCLFT